MSKKIIGLDEVGTGPGAGPVVVAGVLIEPGTVEGVRDSKMVAESSRFELADLIRRKAEWTGVAIEHIEAVNRDGVRACWRRCVIDIAVEAHRKFPDADILMDGGYDAKVLDEIPFLKFVTNGDDTVYQIAAASLVAKAHRDRIMIAASLEFPGYAFQQHKGYLTPGHLDAIRKLGMCPIHRIRQVQKALNPKKGKKVPSVESQVADFSPAETKGYLVICAEHESVMSDWEKKFTSDIRFKAEMGTDLTPRQKFFLREVAGKVEKRAKKLKA